MTARPRLRALVLAAGRGTRLRPLTDEIPKPLVPVAGRPLVSWTLALLRRAGCDAAALNLHHHGDAVRATLGERFSGLPLVYSEEPELLGTGGALPPLAEFLGAAEAVLVVNGDSLCRWPLAELLATHRRRRAAATLLVHRTVDPHRFGGGIAVEGRRVVAFRPGHLAWETARCRRVFAGAAVLAPELLARLPGGASDIVAALYEPLLDAGETLATCETARAWFDLGTPARYLEGALAWALDGRPRLGAWTGPAARIAARARLRRVAVESGAEIGEGARLEEALVLPGARVGAGARLERVVVGPGVEVAAATSFAGVLLTRSADGTGAPRETALAPDPGGTHNADPSRR